MPAGEPMSRIPHERDGFIQNHQIQFSIGISVEWVPQFSIGRRSQRCQADLGSTYASALSKRNLIYYVKQYKVMVYETQCFTESFFIKK